MAYARILVALIAVASPARGLWAETIDGAGTAESPAEQVYGEEIVVVATRTEQSLSDLPSSIAVLERAEIAARPVATVDEVLRRTPGFALFRDSSSTNVTTPTTAIAFRGLGGVSASRALVLVDGVPLNDAFGGWVVWTRVPVDWVERVEVVRSGSVVWGNLAAGGLVQVVTQPPVGRRFMASATAGNFDTFQASTALDGRMGGAQGFSVRGAIYESGGPYRVAARQRGPADVRAPSEHHLIESVLRGDLANGGAWSLKAGTFHDSRELGDGVAGETTNTAYLSGATEWPGAGGLWRLNGYTNRTDFSARSSTFAPGRSTSTLATDQFDVPSTSAGGNAQWTRAAGRHEVSFGADAAWVEGETNDDSRRAAGRFTLRRRAGGRQVLAGTWAQDVFDVGARWRLVAAARLDSWRTEGGFRRERDLVTGSEAPRRSFPSNAATELSPSLGVVYRPTANWTVRSTVSGGFRAPTTNELYRPIRFSGDVVQESNAALEPERLRSAEVGASFASGTAVRSELTAFWAELDGFIAGVTMGVPPPGGGVVSPCGFLAAGATCRQRQNVGVARSRGLEAALELRLASPLHAYAHATVLDTEVVRAQRLPQLVGNRVPAAPDGIAGAGLRLTLPRWGATLDGRWVGARYDDINNQLRLGEIVTVNAAVQALVRPGVTLLVAGENLLDRENPIARGAVPELGAPATVRAGVRWQPAAR